MSMFARASNITINNSNFHAQRFSSPKGGFERLQEFVAHGAFHDSGERFDPPKCHPNTRVAIIKRITDWLTGVDEDTRETLIAWLYGAAGAGKSAIAQTIAEILDGLHVVLASFFFSRNDTQRGTAKLLVPTLAYQLAAKLPHLFRDSISRAFENDPLIITRSLDAQFKSLVREPLFELFQSGYSKNNHIVIVIDGLDECNDPLAQAGIVEVAFRLIQSSRGIPLKILIASRPEIYISTAFESKPSSSLERVALDDDYQSFKDIRCFLSEKLSQIKAQHHLRAYIPGNWPPLDVLDILVGRSSGQFIYASTVAKYVASPRHRPTHRIDTVLGIRPLKAGDDNPFSELDALYRHILMGAEEVDMALKVIGLLVLHHFEIYTGISVAFAEAFLSLDPGDVQLLMQNLSSIVSLNNISLGSIHKDVYAHILHASLKDYLLDQSRSKDLFLDPLKMHTHYAELSLAQINAGFNGFPGDRNDVLRRLFYHCPLAEANTQLLTGVLDLSFSRCLSIYHDRCGHAAHFIDDYFRCLNCLKINWNNSKISPFVENEEIAFQQFIKCQLGPCLPHLHVAFFLAFILLGGHRKLIYQSSWPSFKLTDMGKSLGSARGTIALLGNLFEYIRMLPAIRKLLSDSLQHWIIFNGIPGNTPTIYANAALFALRYIATSFPYAMGGKCKSLHYLRTRTHSPAQSRWYRQHVDPSYNIRYKNGRFRDLIGNTAGRNGFVDARLRDKIEVRRRQNVNSVFYAFSLTMNLLPKFLDKSGYSEELIAYARHVKIRRNNHYLKYLYPTWGEERRCAQNAITAYLRRVDNGHI